MVQVPFTPRNPVPLPPELSDDLLVGRALDGDKAAFTALVERYERPVHALARRMLQRPADAEDAAQETFVRAYLRLSSFRRGSNFRAWLLSITAHWCIDQLRRHQALPLDACQSIAEKTDSPETQALRAERRREVRRQIATLPDNYRQVLELRYWQELSYAEVSAAIDEPPSTIRMRLFRAHRLMRAALAEAEGYGA